MSGADGGQADGTRPRRLSSPLAEFGAHAEVVVVGSGYGGAVMASRLARAGRDVVVLERGPERHPGEFPDRLTAASRELQVRTAWGRIGDPRALFDVRVSQGQSVLVGCGLGGTSLINANVSLRAGAEVFDDDRWPEELRGDGHRVLDPYYARAEAVLGARRYPDAWPALPKMQGLAAGAMALGEPMVRTPINVTFSSGANAVGVHQDACTLCGDCCSGCNVGAKNTVLMNYLPDAVAHGARIFTEVAVERVRRGAGTGAGGTGAGGRWLVDVMPADGGRRRFGAPPLVVSADVVVLAAGTLGSTEILLRSREAGLEVSDRLGERFNGNGDVLGFAYDTDVDVSAVGWGAGPPTGPVGPTISGRITLPGATTHDEVTVEEGSIPGALAPVVPPVAVAATLARRDLGLLARLRLAGRAARLATRRTLTYLVMSSDDGDGRLRLGRHGVEVDWADVGREPVFASDNEALRTAAGAIGGGYLAQPAWSEEGGFSVVTVHPLGGCVMADDAERGVVDHRGRVFVGPAGAAGAAVHEGLLVADGSIVPRPLDVNPLLTISALAERSADELARERGWPLDGPVDGAVPPPARDPDPAPEVPRSVVPAPPPEGQPTATRLWFTERMAGWMSPPDRFTLAPARDRHPVGSTPLEFVLTLTVDDVDAVLADASTPLAVAGTVEAPALSPEPLLAVDGEMRLLEPVPDEVETWHMHYAMDLVATDGRRFHFDGIKVIRNGPPWKAWPETTTLYVRITEGGTEPEGPSGPVDEVVVVGVGALRIAPRDFARQLATMQVAAPGGAAAGRRAKVAFARLFTGRLFRIFGGLVDEMDRFVEPPAVHRELRLPAPESAWCDAAGGWHDGAEVGPDARLKLTRFRGGDRGPVLLAPGFGMAASSYLGRTTPTNLTEFLVEAGYDVWLFDYRASIELPSARTEFSIDDVATVDWPEAVAEVRARTGAPSVAAFGHCVGSSSLLMALGAGLEGVHAAVCSQFSLHPHTSLLNQVKCTLRVGAIVHDLGLRGVAPDTRRSVANVVADVAMAAVPMPRDEHCGQAVCRFINSIYGCTHTHAQLDDATHRSLVGAFGYGNSRALAHLATIMRRRLCVDEQGRDVYTRHPERLAIPIHFLAGAHNYIFRPSGTEATLEWLRAHNDPRLYSCTYLPDYAHLDGLIGRTAHEDVFPAILAHLEPAGRPVAVG
jgi:cholesterol oxidase